MAVPDGLRVEQVKVYAKLRGDLTPDDVPPEAIVENAAGQLAPFRVLPYIEYRAEFPRTPSGKVRKHELISEKPDLRSGRGTE